MSTYLVPKDDNKPIQTRRQDVVEVEDDFDVARENVYTAIVQGQKALEEMMQIASSSQHPAAYDVLIKMVKVQSDLSKTLLKIHEQKRDVKEDNRPQEQGKQGNQQNLDVEGDVVQNKIIVASTEELAKMLSGKKDDEQ